MHLGAGMLVGVHDALLYALVVGVAVDLAEHDDAYAITVARKEIAVLEAQAPGARLARREPAAEEAEGILRERQRRRGRQRSDELAQRRIARAEAGDREPGTVVVRQQAVAVRGVELREHRAIHRTEPGGDCAQAAGGLQGGGESIRGATGAGNVR